MPSNPPVPATPLDIEACVRLLTHFAAQEEARAEFMDEQARKILRMNTAYTVDRERENAAEYREQAATLRALITFLRSALPGMGEDSERLDWLESKVGGSVSAVIAHSYRGRGLASLSVRDAIDAVQGNNGILMPQECHSRRDGRELDALIAEKVMGWTLDPSRCPVCGWTFAGDVASGCVPGNCSMRPAPKQRYDEPPRYSTDIAAAWQVVEKMRGRGFDFMLRNFGTYTMDFDARDLSGTWSRDGGTAPRAICLAALAARAAQPEETSADAET